MGNDWFHEYFIDELKAIGRKQLQTGGSSAPVSANDVTFYDYDGTIVVSYSLEEAQALTALPDAPAHEGLTFQGWNYTLEKVKAFIRPMNVSAIYTTNDGKTHIYITLGEGRTSPLLGCCPNGTVIVDWGDGTPSDTLTGTSTSTIKYTPTHNYASPGNYVISLAVNGTCGFLGSTMPNDRCYLLKYSTTEDGRNKYYQNTITKIEFGDNITSIGENAFSSCDSLTSIIIPDSVTSIGENAFGGCASLRSITIPDSVTSIGEYAFSSCYSLTSITIPDSVTSIGGYAFSDCDSLTSIIIPDNITSIGENAFGGCNSLRSIIIPDGVTSIGEYAFSSCYSLTSITIPDSVTSIGLGAFGDCNSLRSITISDSVTSIGGYAFGGCASLRSITIPYSVTSIEGEAFGGCNSLRSIIIPDGVTSIGEYAFSSCYSLTSITIPDSVTSIGIGAFSHCYGMTEYHLKSTTPLTLSNINAFDHISSDCIIYVPKGCLNAYKTATNWATYASYMQEETA